MATTWNPSDNVGPFALSAGNLRASAVGVSGNIGVRAVDSVSGSVKRYAEYVANSDFHNFYDGPGVVRPDVSIAGNVVAGTNGVSVGNNGGIQVNQNIIVAGYVSAGNGHLYRQAYDHGAALFWSAIDSGNWNNNALANPATGVGGVDVSGTGSINGHDAVPYIASSTSSIDMTARFASGSWGFAAPSGFTEYGAAPPPETDLTAAPGLGISQAAALSIIKALTATNHALGISQAVALALAQDLTVAPSLGIALAVNFGNNSLVNASAGLGLAEAVTLYLRRTLTVAAGLGLSEAATLSLTKQLAASPGLGISMAAVIAHVGGHKQPVVVIVN